MDERDFKKSLNPEQYRVMRQKGTETPFSGKHWDNVKNGVYSCAACGTELFSSKDKFDRKTGWPSFRKPIDEKDLEFKQERDADQKVEVRCKKCQSHLGYVISGSAPYYQINSACLNFEEQKEFGLDELKENLEKVQDAKERIEKIQKPDDKNSKQSGDPSFLKNLSLLAAGGLVGASAIAAVVISGVATPLICSLPGAIAQPIGATSTARTLPAQQLQIVNPRATSTSSGARGATSTSALPASDTPSSAQPATSSIATSTGIGNP